MNNVQHFSFDLWLTLIKSNPDYKRKRAEWIYNTFNPKHLTHNKVIEIIRTTDKCADRLNEGSGRKIASSVMCRKILLKLGVEPATLSPQFVADFHAKVNALFTQYRPELLNPQIPSMLKQLKDSGFGINLSSNTGFIEGTQLVPVLQELEIAQYFDFYVFSDQINASKPFPAFFDVVYAPLKATLQKQQIVHVGDNVNADYRGAKRYGFQAVHITTRDYSYADIVKAGLKGLKAQKH